LDYFDCATETVDANHDPVLALGTIVIAVFTGTLWWSTHKRWQAGERQTRVSRQQAFFSTASAKAAVHSARVAE
jgi:hypothetical protein